MRKFFLIVSIFYTITSVAQSPLKMLVKKVASGLTPPSFIQEAETAWNTTTSPKTTASFNVTAGDILVAVGITENSNTTISSISGGSLTWTQQEVISTASRCWIAVWTATATSTTSITVTFTRNANVNEFGGNVFTFRSSGGVGAHSSTQAAGGTPSLAITTTAANSTVVCFNGDFQAVDGTSRTWRTVNSITPTSGNGLEQTYQTIASHYTVYGSYYNNVGAAGSKTVGLSAPAAQDYSVIAIEIKGN